MSSGGFFSLELLTKRPGLLVFRVHGEGSYKAFEHEPGGHRWQRIPSSEKRGRVHTSTVTVAVLPEPSLLQVKIQQKDITCKTTRGSGGGGQHRNTADTAVVLRHNPTGISVRVESERSQTQNKESAMAILRARVWQLEEAKSQAARASSRKKQVGSGMRADKRRTIRCQDGQVTDHVLKKRWQLKAYLRGQW